MIERTIVLALALAGCGAGAADEPVWPDAGAVCQGSSILYLNRGGGLFVAGATDSVADTSELLASGRTVEVPGFAGNDEDWDQIVTCVRAVMSDYALMVTDATPGAVDHLELVITSVGPDLGLPYTYSVTPQACATSPRGLGFVFAGAHGNRITAVCMTTLRALGHLLGLEHVTACDDVMSEAPGCALDAPGRRFLDTDAPCGLVGEAACTCAGGRTQNAHQLLNARLGPCQP